jgi:ABC-type spermidine/putrescine transport system permease subunit II
VTTVSGALQRWLPFGAAPATLYLAALLVVPIGALFAYSIFTAVFFGVEYTTTLENYREVLSDDLYRTLILRSIGIGLLVAAVSLPAAFAIAYFATFRSRRGTLILVLLLAPLFASYIVRVFAWVLILGPNGFINRGLLEIGLIDEPLAALNFGKVALVITLSTILIPLAVLPIYAALQNVPPTLLEASRDLGETPGRTFLRVTFPLVRPAVAAAFVFVFLLSAADYLTPQLVGGRGGFLVGRAIADQFGPSGNFPLGGALSFITLLALALTVAGVLGGTALAGRVVAGAVRRLPARPAPSDQHARASRRRPRVPVLGAVVWAVGAFLYAPLAVLILMSFSNAGVLPIRSLTTDWYAQVLDTPAFGQAIATSALVAAVSVALALLIGIPAAFALARRSFRLRRLFMTLVGAPLLIPGVVVGVAILTTLAALSRLPGFGPTVFAHVWLSLPFVVLILQARLARFDRRVEEAARDLGSSFARTLRTVTLPIIAPTVLATAIVAWVWSMDEFLVSNFVVGTDTTLPVYLYSQLRFGVTPVVNAVATLMLAASVAVLLLAAGAMRLLARRGQAGPQDDLATTLVSTHHQGAQTR